jgi:hypothetical protein
MTGESQTAEKNDYGALRFAGAKNVSEFHRMSVVASDQP